MQRSLFGRKIKRIILYMIMGKFMTCETVSGKNDQQDNVDSNVEGSTEGDEDQSDLDFLGSAGTSKRRSELIPGRVVMARRTS